MKAVHGRKRTVILTILLILLLAGAGLAGLRLRKSGEASGTAGSAAPPAAAGSGTTGSGHGAVALAAAKGGGEAEKASGLDGKTAVPVSVAVVATGAVSSYITSTANLVAENEVKILAEAEGRVAELGVEEGNRVGRSQVLASLAHEDAEITLRKAQLRAARARSAFERSQKLVADNLVSREDYDKIGLDNEVAQQELAEAQWHLEKTFIRAPIGGRITERSIKLGQHVRPGDTLFTVCDFDPLIARLYLPEKDVLGLKQGRAVRITLKADEQTRFQGRIRQISPVVDTATGTVKVTVEAMAPPAEVRPGAFVTIDIVREVHPQAILLPREAVIRELQDSFVFVAKGDLAEKRPVSLGLEEGGRVEALSGVAAGDRVIVAGQGGLKQGSPIKIIPAHEASDLRAAIDRAARG